MDNRISENRRVIRALRLSMREAEAVMQEQIRRDQDCSFVADEIMKMRKVMSGLVQERIVLGDTAPIVVSYLSLPRRPATPPPAPRPLKRKLAGSLQA